MSDPREEAFANGAGRRVLYDYDGDPPEFARGVLRGAELTSGFFGGPKVTALVEFDGKPAPGEGFWRCSLNDLVFDDRPCAALT